MVAHEIRGSGSKTQYLLHCWDDCHEDRQQQSLAWHLCVCFAVPAATKSSPGATIIRSKNSCAAAFSAALSLKVLACCHDPTTVLHGLSPSPDRGSPYRIVRINILRPHEVRRRTTGFRQDRNRNEPNACQETVPLET